MRLKRGSTSSGRSPRSEQGRFAPLAAVLLLALGVMGVVVQIADIRRMRSEIAALDTTIDQAFHYVFPGAGPIQDALRENAPVITSDPAIAIQHPLLRRFPRRDVAALVQCLAEVRSRLRETAVTA